MNSNPISLLISVVLLKHFGHLRMATLRAEQALLQRNPFGMDTVYTFRAQFIHGGILLVLLPFLRVGLALERLSSGLCCKYHTYIMIHFDFLSHWIV